MLNRLRPLILCSTVLFAGLLATAAAAIEPELPAPAAPLSATLEPNATSPEPDGATQNVSSTAKRGLPQGISGTVTDASTGLPVEGLDVIAFSLPDDASAGWDETDAAGYYFVSLPAGTYRIHVQHSGPYFDQDYGGSQQHHSGTYPVIPVKVFPGIISANKNISLMRGGFIDGLVTAWDGSPLEGAFVNITRPLRWAVWEQTDANGEFVISGVPAGTHYLDTYSGVVLNNEDRELFQDIIWRPSESDTGTPIQVSAGATATGIDLGLGRLGAISGTVTDAGAGSLLEGCEIWGYDYDASLFPYSFTEADGSFTMEARPAGCYAVAASCAGYSIQVYPGFQWPEEYSPGLAGGDPVAVLAGSTTAGIDFLLQEEDGSMAPGAISGTVLGPGNIPVVGAEVYCMTRREAEWSLHWSDSTNQAGQYEITDVYPSSYWVWVDTSPAGGTWADLVSELHDDRPCPYGGCDPNDGTMVEVEAGSATTGIDFELVEGGGLTGTVSFPGGRLYQAPVQLISGAMPDWAPQSRWYYVLPVVMTDWLGDYEFTGLPPGDYRVRALAQVHSGQNHRGFTHIAEMHGGIHCQGLSCDPSLATAVPVAVGATVEDIDIELDPTGSIKGWVILSVRGGPSLRLATVRAWTSTGEDTGIWDLTDASGGYELTGLTTGSYFVTLDTRGAQGSAVGTAYAAVACPAETCDPTTGTAVAVTSGAPTININLFPAPGANISGTVTELGSDQPIPVVTVTATDATGHVFGSDVSDCSGSYEIQGLPTGSFFVFTTNYRGHEDEIWDDVACNGDCLAAGGTLVGVTQGTTTAGVDFVLDTALFKDGFESGDTSAW